MATQPEVVGDGLAILSGTIAVIAGILAIAVAVIMVAALISTVIHGDLTAGGKLLWVLGILWLPLLGAVAWFVVGRKDHLNRLLGIDKGRGHHEVHSAGGHSAGPGGVAPPSPA